MERTQTPVVGTAVLLVAIGAIGVFAMRSGGGDVELCRRTFQGLAEGRPGVQRSIGWERLKALDVDVGAAYAKLPNDGERRQYRQAFIQQFSEGFRRTGGNPEAFVGWRAQGRTDDGRVVVAADYEGKDKTLLLQLSGGWHKKVVGIQWQ
jgi:hypothetical protein